MGAAVDADVQQHAGFEPIAGIRQLGARLERPRPLVDAGVDLGDPAGVVFARIAVARGVDRRPFLDDGEVAVGHVDVDRDHRRIIQGGDGGAGRNQRTGRDIAEAYDSGERRIDHPILQPRLGGVQGAFSGNIGGLVLFGRRRRRQALRRQLVPAVGGGLGEIDGGLGLGNAGVLGVLAQFKQHLALLDPVAGLEQHPVDHLAGGGRQGYRLPALGHALDVEAIGEDALGDRGRRHQRRRPRRRDRRGPPAPPAAPPRPPAGPPAAAPAPAGPVVGFLLKILSVPATPMATTTTMATIRKKCRRNKTKTPGPPLLAGQTYNLIVSWCVTARYGRDTNRFNGQKSWGRPMSKWQNWAALGENAFIHNPSLSPR